MAECYKTARVRRHGGGLRAGRRWPRAVRVLGAVTLLVGITGVVTAGAAQASQPIKAGDSTWTIVPTPNPDSDQISSLSAVSCTSAKACTAVGSSTGALAERWNGNSWRIQPTATPKGAVSPQLFGVSCPAANACIAAGYAYRTATSRDVTLAEAWNGKSWRVQAAPNPKGATESNLYAVSCTSAKACTAVGHYDNAKGLPQALVERWNGTSWRLQATPAAGIRSWFTGVSCSSPNACIAVGYYWPGLYGNTSPLAEAWNGMSWHAQKVPFPTGSNTGVFAAVSCTKGDACTATGTGFGAKSGPTLAERWNGKTWRVQPTPNPANYRTSFGEVSLNGVSCTSTTACTASGEYSPGGSAGYFLEAWNGKTWRLATAPFPVHFASGALFGMSCAAARCTAVGDWSGGVRAVATLAMTN